MRILYSTVVVNSVLDSLATTAGSSITLRDAIAAANASTTPTDITFDPQVFARLRTIKLDGQPLTINTQSLSDAVTITAPATGLIIAGHRSGDFVVAGNTAATLTGLTIRGGKSTTGGGIDNSGNLTVTDSTITGNSSPNGGGVYTTGTASFTDVTITRNAGHTGGGIWNDGGNLSLTNVTIVGNSAIDGGGIYNGGPNDGTSTLTNCTIAGNSAKVGSGVFSDPGATITITGTIIASNRKANPTGTNSDVDGTFTSSGLNLIGNPTGGGGWASTDLLGSSARPLNPKLSKLADHGGPTETLSAAPTSPAMIDGNGVIGATESATPASVPTTPSTLPVPTIISPGSTDPTVATVVSNSPTFTWDAITSGITGFQLNLYNITLSKFISYQIDSDATSFTLPTALPGGDSFVWNLRVLNGTATGTESAYLYFQTAKSSPTSPINPTTLPIPTILTPGSTTSPGPVLTTNAPTFTWDAITSGITGFQLNLYNVTSKQFTSYQIDPAATSFTVPTTLAGGDTFVWNLRVIDVSVTGTESAYLYFQTPAAASPTTLPVPTVISPGSTNSSAPALLTTTTPTFTWDPITSGITGFQLNLYDETEKLFVSYQIPASATSFTVPTPLTGGDTFIWNLRVVNGSTTGMESTYLSFQTPGAVNPTTLPVPTVISPGSTNSSAPMLVTSITPTFTWDPITTGITGYQLNIFNVTTQQSISYQFGISLSSFTVPTALAGSDTYFWNLRAVDGNITGTASTYLYFQTPAAVNPTTLPVPTVIGPGSTNSSAPTLITTTTPTFTWEALASTSGITGFQINLYNETTKQSVSYQTGVGDTSFTVPAALDSGDTYVWNLRVVDGTVTGSESAYLYFQTPAAVNPATLPVPTVIGPGSTNSSAPTLITTTTPTFTWQPLASTSGITGFQINLDNQTTGAFVSYQTGVSVTSFTVPTALPNGDIFVWNLRAVDGSVTGMESAYLYFQTPAAVNSTTLPVPTVIGPGSTNSSTPTLVSTTPTFTWQPLSSTSGITGFQINLYNQTTSTSVSYQTGVNDTSFTVHTPLPSGDTFVWNLRVVDGSVTGMESAYLYFKTST